MDNIAELYESESYSGNANTKCIPHSRPTVEEKDILAVTDVLESGGLADTAQVTLFEKELASYVGHTWGVATNSGTNALYLALLSLGDDSRNEVIIPSYTCIAPLNAIHSAHLTPIIVDIDDIGYNISLSAVKRAINHRTKAIIAPHMFGDPISDIQEIVDLGVPVIEDCALSVGASLDGRKVGSIGELAVFSFYATKLLTTGHGGMVLTSSDTEFGALTDVMQYDHRHQYRPSVNFRLTDFQAALGRSQLTRLDDFIAKRKEIAVIYDECLKEMDVVVVPPRIEQSIYFRYIVQADDANYLIDRMRNQGVDCKKPIYKPLHQYVDLDVREYPNAERAHKRNVSIPIYPALSEREIEYIIRVAGAC